MCTAGLLALLFDIEILAELVSIGTLVVFSAVCAGVLFRCARFAVSLFGFYYAVCCDQLCCVAGVELVSLGRS